MAIPGLANQSETKSYISYSVTAKTHIIHTDTHEYQSPHFFLTHTHTFASYICCNYHTPTWQWQNFTRHLLLCMLFSGTSGNYVRAAGNWAASRGWPSLGYTVVTPPQWLACSVTSIVV